MRLIIERNAKGIAALALELQERQEHVVNQLVLDTINNAPGVQNGTIENPPNRKIFPVSKG